MEEFQFFADPLSQGDPILGLNPGPILPQPLDWDVDSVDPFYPEIDDIRGFNCLPEPGMLNPYQDTAFTTLGCFGTTIRGLQPEIDAIPGYVDHPNLDHTSTVFFPGQDFAALGHSYCLDIADFSMDGVGSSPTSEGLSPASQEMFPLSPLSSVAPLGSPQEPVYTDSSFSNTMIEVGMGLSPPFQQIGGAPSVRAPKLRRRREGPARQVPPLQTPKRILRMERPDLYGEKCEHCQRCFPYAADLEKHVIAKHYVDLGKPKPEYHCNAGNCSRVYTRSDRLYRHGVNKHGWQAGGTRRNRRRAVNGGQQN